MPHLSAGPNKPKKNKKPALPPDALFQDDPEKVDITRGPSKRVVIPIWAERWSKQALMDKRIDLGAREFDRGYRQLAISEEDLTWREEWISDALELEMAFPQRWDEHPLWKGMRRFGGVDLAIATSESEGSFFVITIVGVDQRNNRWLLWQERQRGITFGHQMSLIRELHERYQCEVFGVESNAYQEAVHQYLKDEGIVPVRAIHTGALQKNDLEVGVPSLAVEFEQRRWHIPYGDATARRIANPLLEEMRAFPSPGVSTDCIMSTFFAREMHRLGPAGRPQIHLIRF